jgi:hypothetical protein
MVSRQEPPPPPPPPAEPAPTTLFDLGEDLLLEILLLLPSLPSLVRAAFACRTFLHAVRSSPAFRRRFRALHPPPLLGLYFDPDGAGIPAFAPLRRRSDPDLRAAVRRADFFLTGLPDDDDHSPGWVISDCHDGYLILGNCTTGQVAAYNPLTQALDLIPRPPADFYDGFRGFYDFLDYHIISPEEDDGVFHVIFACYDESRVRAAAFCSDTGAWQVFPWFEALTTPQPADQHWLTVGEMVNGFVYWIYAEEAAMLVLNTTTLQFSKVDLPPDLEGQTHMFMVGKTKDGGLCIVVTIGFELHIWLRKTSDDDGIEKWVNTHAIGLQNIVEQTGGTLEEHARLKVVAVVDGFVYFSTFETFRDGMVPCWFFSLDLETSVFDILFQRRSDGHIHPYIMPWPTSLIRDKACLQVEGA